MMDGLLTGIPLPATTIRQHGRCIGCPLCGIPVSSAPFAALPPQVSATLLGEPDMGLLTQPEMARKVGQIAAASPSLVVFADADTGARGGGDTFIVTCLHVSGS